jgi:hypothetical protein
MFLAKKEKKDEEEDISRASLHVDDRPHADGVCGQT